MNPDQKIEAAKRIQDLSDADADLMFRGMKALLKNYEENKYMKQCIFCVLVVGSEEGCRRCPWKIITDEHCFEFRDREFLGYAWFDLIQNKDQRWRTVRIQMLREWIEFWSSEIIKRHVEFSFLRARDHGKKMIAPKF